MPLSSRRYLAVASIALCILAFTSLALLVRDPVPQRALATLPDSYPTTSYSPKDLDRTEELFSGSNVAVNSLAVFANAKSALDVAFAQWNDAVSLSKADSEALVIYGNTLASLIQSFLANNPHLISVIAEHAQDRGNPRAQESIMKLAYSYIALGQQITKIPTPDLMLSSNESLAELYILEGRSLLEIASSTDDAHFLSAAMLHNENASKLAETLYSTSLILQGSGVEFSAADPGMMFMMPMGI